MFNQKKELYIEVHDVIYVLRLIGKFGLKFEVSDEFDTPLTNEGSEKLRYRQIVIRGRRKKLEEFEKTLNMFEELKCG